MAPRVPETRRLSKPAQWVMALAVCTFLNGCGPLGQDDDPEEPLVTVQASEDAAISTPVPRDETRSAGTPARDSTPASGAADGDVVSSGDEAEVDEDRATPRPRTGVGDGTSGATPQP